MYRRTPEEEWIPAHGQLFGRWPADLAELTPFQLDALHAYTDKATEKPGRRTRA